MADSDGIPTSADVVEYLNERFALRGLDTRVSAIEVLPYVNPMWLANWDLPGVRLMGDEEIIEEELREARWLFPQILQNY